MDWMPDIEDVEGALIGEHFLAENHKPEEDDGVLGDDPFKEEDT